MFGLFGYRSWGAVGSAMPLANTVLVAVASGEGD